MRSIALWLISGIALAGCARTPYVGVRRVDPPRPAVQPGVAFEDEVITGAESLPLYARRWRPEQGEVRAAIVFMNGLKDHGDHYAALAQRLVKRGYAAYAFDLRGHGRSAGDRVEVDGFDQYVDDLAEYVERVRAAEPGKPIFVFGHSMGGAIVTLWAIERQPKVAGILLSGPALEIDAPAIQIAVVRGTDELFPEAPLFDLGNEDFSRDPAVVADMNRDPLIFQRPAPVHTAAALLDAMHRIWARPEALTLPLLAMHGTADKLTAPSGSRDLVARAGSTDKTLRLYPGLFHDLVHEPEKERVIADMTAWLDAHAGAGGAPPTSSPDTGSLAGDRGPSSTSLEIDGRAEHSLVARSPLAMTGGLRLRQGFGPWLGGIDARVGSQDGFLWLADAHPLGVGARFGALTLGLTGGIGARGLDGTTTIHAPAEFDLELSLGPLRALSRAALAWSLNHGGPGTSVLGVADEASALLGVRFGRDVAYWRDVRAGQGPFVGVTYAKRDGADLWGVAIGVDLWGAGD